MRKDLFNKQIKADVCSKRLLERKRQVEKTIQSEASERRIMAATRHYHQL